MQSHPRADPSSETPPQVLKRRTSDTPSVQNTGKQYASDDRLCKVCRENHFDKLLDTAARVPAYLISVYALDQKLFQQCLLHKSMALQA